MSGLGLDRAWAQAAACLAGSVLRTRAEELAGLRGLRDLVRVAWPDPLPLPDLPEKPLLAAFQDALARQQRRTVASLLAGITELPHLLALDLAGQEAGAAAVWEICRDMDDEPELARLAGRELTLAAVGRALRLRATFGLGADEAATLLGRLGPGPAAAVRSVFERPLDQAAAWQDWGFAAWLPEGRPDPVAFGRAVDAWATAAWWHHFHACPLSVGSIHAFVRLVDADRRCLVSLAEGLVLGVTMAELVRLAGRPELLLPGRPR